MFKIDLKLSIDKFIFECGYVLFIILLISCNKDVKVYSTESNQDSNLSELNTNSTSSSSSTDPTSDSSSTDSTETCSLNDQQSGNLFELRIPDFEYINAGDEIQITMYSDVYSSGQVKNISLYKNDEEIHDWGDYLTLSNNQRNLVLPSSLSASSCYNIRVFEEGPSVSSTDDESYISRLFEVRTD